MDDVVLKNDSPFAIRKLAPNDGHYISGALRVFASHGLYESYHSMATYLQIDCNGFYVAIDETNDEVIGVCGGPSLRPGLAFIGLYAVDKRFFGRGIGQKLFKCVMDNIGDSNCCLFGVPDKMSLYRDQLGFRLVSAQTMFVYFGKCEKTDEELIDCVKLKPISSDEVMDEIIEYDQHIHRYKRERLLRLSLKEPECLALAAIDTNSGRVVGYGCIRGHSSQTSTLSPVYADSYEIAKHLIHSLVKSFESAVKSGFFFYTIDTNVSAARIAEELAMETHEVCPLMYSKEIIDVDYQKIYSVLTPNFSL